MAKGGKRTGAGVKPRSGEVSKNHSIKFTDSEWETIRQLATASGQTISDYIRTKATK